jgi:hypothetical protein
MISHSVLLSSGDMPYNHYLKDLKFIFAVSEEGFFFIHI